MKLYASALTIVLNETANEQYTVGYDPISDGKRIVSHILGRVYRSKYIKIEQLIFEKYQ